MAATSAKKSQKKTAAKLAPKGTPAVEHLLSTCPAGQKSVLHIGCGRAKGRLPEDLKEYWEISLDLMAELEPDIVADMRDLSLIPEESVDALYSSHNLEHVHAFEVEPTLRGFLRVLKTGGKARLHMPDIQRVAQYIVEKGLEATLYVSPSGPIRPLDVLYGHSGCIANGHVEMMHKTGFSAQTLAHKLWKSGFRDIVITKQNFELQAEAYKREPGYDDKGKAMVRDLTNKSG